MDEIWQQLSSRRFKPSEACAITGVSPDLQRKWIERYFSKPADTEAVYHWRIAAEGAHSRYTWAGVQALALFGDILADVGVEVAKMALDRTSRGGLLHDFEVDWRDRGPGADICFFYGFDRPGTKVTTTTLANIPSRLGSPVWSTRFYLYNYSALQRRLVEAAKKVSKQQLEAGV